MSRPIPAKSITVNHMEFGDCLAIGDSQLMAVMAGGAVEDAVAMAADLSEGMRSLLRHVHASTNCGELVFCSDLKVLAFLSDAILTLTRSAELAMTRASKGADQ